MFLTPFPFKWNNVFYAKGRRFMQCSHKKSAEQCCFNNIMLLLLPLDAQGRGRIRIFPCKRLSLAPPLDQTPASWATVNNNITTPRSASPLLLLILFLLLHCSTNEQWRASPLFSGLDSSNPDQNCWVGFDPTQKTEKKGVDTRPTLF
jgi:hypothetical protein